MTDQSNSHSKIVWDDSHVRTIQPNAWKVTGTREEIVLVFGKIQGSHESQEQDKIDLTERIVLSPFVAKRLAMALDMGIRQYESRYGPLDENAQVQPGKGLVTPPAEKPPLHETESSDDKAEWLFRLIKDIDGEAGFERSFKLFEKTLLGNRFLLGMSKKALGQKPHEKTLDICARMNMPGNLLEAFERYLPDADYLHFGFEENERTCLYKAYLEFYEKIEKEMKTRPNTSDHFVMHLGFKWDAWDRTKQSLSTYTWYPSLSIKNTVKRLSSMLDPHQHRTSLELAKGIISTASRRVSHQDILYLEVTEEGNPRKSFDINMYRANLQLGELYPFFLDMCRHYSIPPAQFHILYEPVKTQIFGHLSGGIDREARDFLTVYYGVEGIQGLGAKSGLPAVKAPLGAKARRRTPSRKKSSFVGVESTDEKAGLLFRLVNSLHVQVGFERSFKVLKKTFLADRFLLGFRRKALRQEPHEGILNICRQIDMPEDFLEAFRQYLPESNIVLFGFEGNERKRLYKAYLEFGDRIREVLKENPDKPEPFPMHMAFKWDASDNAQKTSARYTCFPSWTIQEVMQRLATVFYSHQQTSPFKIVEAIINLAASRIDPDEFIYFEANERDNPRVSFDINMYRANLRMNELYPLLLEIMHHYSIPDEPFHNLYRAVSSHIFGHLTGGIDREGRDFLTVYFGEKGSSGQIAGG